MGLRQVGYSDIVPGVGRVPEVHGCFRIRDASRVVRCTERVIFCPELVPIINPVVVIDYGTLVLGVPTHPPIVIPPGQ